MHATRWSLFGLILALAACPASDDSGDGAAGDDSGSTGAAATDGSACTPGEAVGCACTDGSSGTQVCRGDGSGFDACECGGAGGTGAGDSTTGPGADSTGGGDDGSGTTDGGETGPAACEPGTAAACDCPDGPGVQLCDDAGEPGACECCMGTHPLVEGDLRYCEAGACYCGALRAVPPIDSCYVDAIAEACCPGDIMLTCY